VLLIPIGLDEEEVRRVPWVSYALIAANVAVFVWELLDVASGGSPLQSWGYVPAEGTGAHILTSMFLHAGVLHLVGNMLFFFVTGPFLEDAFGRLLFLFLYLSSGFVAAQVHASMNPASILPMVGASGAIAGVMGAFLIRLARRRIRFFWVPLPPLPIGSRQVSIPAFVFLPLWFALQLLLASLMGGDGGVAFGAHIGGFLWGVLLAIVVAATGIERRWIHPAIEAQIGYRPNEELVRAVEETQRGNVEGARRATGRLLARNPRDVDARRLAYEIALEEREAEGIALHATRLLDSYIDSGEKDLARQLIGEAAETAGAALPARFLLRAADFLARNDEPREAAGFYMSIWDRFPSDPTCLRAFLQAAELARRNRDLRGCRRLLERGLQHPACGTEWKPVFDRKLAEISAAETAPAGGYRGVRPETR
jgi:membrane associated rhomboid family serine protease